MKPRKTTPPIISDCVDSTTPRSTTLRKPKMSSSSAMALRARP